MYNLAVRGLYIIVIAVYLNQSCRGQLAVHIVIQAPVFGNYSVLHLGIGIRIGINRRRVYHLAFGIEFILAGGEQAVGHGNPVFLALYSGAGACPEIVIIIIYFYQAHAFLNNTAYAVIRSAVIVKQACKLFLPYAVFIGGIARGILVNGENTGFHITVGAIAKVILLAVKLNPLVAHPFAGPTVMRTVGILNKIAAHKPFVFKNVVVAVYFLISVNSLKRCRIKVEIAVIAILIQQIPPA